MGLRGFLLLGLATSALWVGGPAGATSRITGMDIYGHGVVTASEPSAPPVGAINPIHIKLTLWDPFVGNPYAPIPSDATGTFHYLTIGGPWGFEVNIRDAGSWAFCETCSADFSLLNGQLSGPFAFSAGVDPVHFVYVTDSEFWGEILGPGFSTVRYSGTFALDSVLIHTDAPAPEPATWVLMLAGFFGLGQALRMARRPSSTPSLG